MNTELFLFLIPAVAVFLFVYGFYVFIMERQERAKENIRELLGHKDGVKRTIVNKAHEDMILKKRHKDETSLSAKIENDLERANMLLRLDEFVIVCGVLGAGTFILTLLAMGHGLFQAIIEAVVMGLLPLLFIKLKAWMRINKANAQFADVMDMMVNSFKTGFGFNRAVQTVADNFGDPWGTEFGKMAAELTLGSTQDNALHSMKRRMPLADVEMFVTAMMIQKETGGNLAELLGNISNLSRQRFKLYRKISAISAQGKLSALIVCLVPLGLVGLMSIFIPEGMHDFTHHPIGIVLLCIVGIWALIGVGVLYKIVNIEV